MPNTFTARWEMGNNRLYRYSGQFTGVVQASIDVGALYPGYNPSGISWDGSDVFFSITSLPEVSGKLLRMSGAFSSIIKSSLFVTAMDPNVSGISWTGANTIWCGDTTNKLWEQSGRITSTIKTSLAVGGIQASVRDLSYDGTNTFLIGDTSLNPGPYKVLSGKFTTVVKSSASLDPIFGDNKGISSTGTDTLVACSEIMGLGRGGILLLLSGKVTSVIKTSLDVSYTPEGVETSDFTGRLGGGAGGTTPVIWYYLDELDFPVWSDKAMAILKNATATTIKMGPFVNTAGVVQTGLTIAQADIRVSKNGADFAQSNNVAGATHDENGMYDVPLDVTDTNTNGRLVVLVNVAGALPARKELWVCSTEAFNVLRGDSVVWDLVRSSHKTEGTFGEAIPSPHVVEDDHTADSHGMPTSKTAYWYDTKANAIAHSKTAVGGNYFKQTMTGITYDADENPATPAKFGGEIVS